MNDAILDDVSRHGACGSALDVRRSLRRLCRRRLSVFVAVVVAVAAVVVPVGTSPVSAQASDDISAERLWGQDRYETSLAVARRFVAEQGGSIEAAVVVSGTSWHDAVIAAGLAGSLDAPVVLSRRDGLTDAALSFLRASGVSQIVVVGTADAVSGAALAAMHSLGTVERVGNSPNPEAASVAVAQRMGEPGEMPGHGVTVIVANSAKFADAMVAGGFSAYGGHPVLLTPRDDLDDGVAAYISASGARHVVVMGGPAAVSAGIETELKALDGVSVTRLGGKTRLHTAIEVADFLEGKYSDVSDERCFDRSTAGLATAWVPFDSFSAGPLLGELCAPLLLTDPKMMDADVAEWLRASTKDLVVFGGSAAVSPAALGAVNSEAALAAVFDRAAGQRAKIVNELTRQIRAGNYGIDSDNMLRGPSGFRIDLDDCPDDWSNVAGITASEIRIGHSVPLSGSLAVYGGFNVGMRNYFDWVNETDPIAGKQIVLVSRDDAYSAPRTIENVNAFIDAENVFSISTLGTPSAMATYDRINEGCVPHPFVQSSHPILGDPVMHPWTTGFQLAYNTEAVLWGTWIAKNLEADLPVKVAGLVMDNDFGAVYETAFDTWAAAHPEVVSEFVPIRHDPSESSVEDLADEMQAIADANPNVYISMTAGNACPSAIELAGANGLARSIRSSGGAMFTLQFCRDVDSYVKPAGSAADGWRAVSDGFKDATDPVHTAEPFVALLNANLAAASLDTSDHFLADGYSIAYPYVEALRIAAELPAGLTRANLMLAVRSLDIDHPLLPDGIRFRLDGAADAYLVEGAEISLYDADTERWGSSAEIIDVDGQTPNCVWTGVSCGSVTRDRLTTIYASGSADLNDSLSAWGYAHRADRDGPEKRLKPGYWQATADSYCLYWDDAAEEWKQGASLGTGWIQVNHVGVEFDQSTRIRIEHGDYIEVTTWSGGNLGARSCELNWVADFD